MPRVLISILAQSKGHALPYFLSCLENLEYPKERIDIWLKIEDIHEDSLVILSAWAQRNEDLYNSVVILSNITEAPRIDDHYEKTLSVTSKYRHLIELREEALSFARNSFSDYVFMLDADAFLTEPDTLKVLVRRRYAVAAPMLVSDDTYSNFWLSETRDLNEEDTNTYMRLVKRERKYLGCAEPPMVFSAVLISLKHRLTKFLTYDPKKVSHYEGPENDAAVFAETAKRAGIRFRLCNDLFYGYIVAPADSPEKKLQKLTDLKLDAIRRENPIPLNSALEGFVSYPKRSKLSCDKIYMINLKRRQERKRMMMMNFKELGLEFKRIPAVDGTILNHTTLKVLNVRLMKDYEDPYHKRPMKAGEVGCFLSHYNIWNKIVRKQYNLTMVLEDDVHFTPNFRDNFKQILWETRNVDYDFIYLGRKILMEADEERVTQHTTRPLYSYWTVGYVITYRGAKKLLEAKPLQKLLPVDEFIPILFDSHPNSTWKSYFPVRNLKALSANPLLIYPTHYVGMPGYISDTEVSYIIDLKNMKINPDLHTDNEI
ncbi:unnamed protein product [Euphydryas editha]|nr:unnamed protein product [Euphydryas editha]